MDLEWKEFSYHTKEILCDLLNDQSSSDVTIVSDDQVKFKAHKFVLRASSKAFKSLLEKENKDAILYLRGIQHQELKSLLDFMYLGEAKIAQERLTEFMSVAKNLKIKAIEESFELSDRTDDFLTKNEAIDIDIIDEAIKDINDSNDVISEKTDDGSEIVPDKTEIKVTEIQSITTNFAKVPDKDKAERIKNLSRKSCDECDYKGTSSALRQHKQSKHEGVKFPCPECDVILSRETHLLKHQNAVHKGVRFQCPHCDYKATQKGNLTRHIWWRPS